MRNPGLTSDRHRRAAGVTLLEVLLVMALLVTVAALAMPDVGRTLDNQRLRTAGEEIRVVWARARVQAMEQGRTYSFRHEPEGTHYIVAPWYSQDDYLESSDLMLAGGDTANDIANEQEDEQTLPDSVSFAIGQTAEDSRAFVLTQGGNALRSGDDRWSTPIFFYPDGTTSTSRLRLTSTRGYSIEVTMRGLTGMVAVKEVDERTEVTP